MEMQNCITSKSAMKTKPEKRYNISEAIGVYVKDRKYYVFLNDEIVVTEVIGKQGKAFLRRVTSRDIGTSAILRASDIYYADK